MKKFFITGTDTDVGKTLVSSLLTLALDAYYWKPIESGAHEKDQVQQWTGLPNARFFPATYSFKRSIAPDQAAHYEGITIDVKRCFIPETKHNLIVEGAGGVHSAECMLELIKQLSLPAIIVSRGTLGTINHTLLTIEALRHRNISIHGIVFNGDLNPDNQTSIERLGKVKTLFHVPKFNEINSTILKSWIKENEILNRT